MGSKVYYIVVSLFAFLTLLSFIPYVNYLKTVEHMKKCVFCEIIDGKMPQTKIELETDKLVIFKDIRPASKHHYLAVPKRHIDSLKSLTIDDIELVNNMEAGLKDFLVSQNIDLNDSLLGFHLPPFITVKHLHMHGIAPKSDMSLKNRFIFMSGTAWFKTPDEARSYIRDRN